MSAAPIKVVHLMLGDKEITPDTPVNLEGKWVGRLSIVVQNVSSKTIVKCALEVDFPESGDGTQNRPIHVIPLSVGRYPKHAFIAWDSSAFPTHYPTPDRAEMRRNA